jgi:hypothetical protein
MTKEAVAHATLKFQGHIPYPHEQKIDDWGLNAEQQASRNVLGGRAVCESLFCAVAGAWWTGMVLLLWLLKSS